jgi:hypothetical protein
MRDRAQESAVLSISLFTECALSAPGKCFAPSELISYEARRMFEKLSCSLSFQTKRLTNKFHLSSYMRRVIV